MDTAMEALTFEFHFISSNLNLNGLMWVVSTHMKSLNTFYFVIFFLP